VDRQAEWSLIARPSSRHPERIGGRSGMAGSQGHDDDESGQSCTNRTERSIGHGAGEGAQPLPSRFGPTASFQFGGQVPALV
jgi:hypothetical protein